MAPTEITGILEFLRRAEQLKDTIRTGHTSKGRQESVAEHTWRLCLMAMVFSNEFPNVDFERLIKICIIHDLGEAIRGDIPAPEQVGHESKADQERNDLLELLAPLPDTMRTEIEGLWDEYETASSSEARLAKALDKLETILQHNQGENPADFDYRFNLDYGKNYTSYDPLIVEIRTILDQETEQHAINQEST
ncbi:MAG: HD domain-containing protein [Rhodothermaceae bacterium]|nr:HD domain-containing protein [Rhodothermaceae bacterium]